MRNLLSIFSILLLISCGTEEAITVESKENVTPIDTLLKHVDWSKNATIYEANIRQMTPEGTFKALEAQLPSIKDLGVKIIWLMPIQPIGELNRKGGLGSYYSVLDYKAVNPEYGNLDDLKSLVNKAHEMDMKIILDWVANHTAWDHTWTIDHPDWYTKDSLGNFAPPVPDWSDVIDLNYDSKEMRKEMISALKYWLTEVDIDGYRCDVAGMVPTDFWNDARKELDEIKPVFMLAEADQTDHHDKAFDMSYGWELMHIMNHVAKGDSTLASIDSYMKREEKRYNSNDYRMFFLTNHDENSWNGTIEERFGDTERAFAVLAYTIDGMPLIYSGQEYGNNKSLEFFEKDTPNLEQPEIFDFYKTLMHLNKNNKALWNGNNGGDYARLSTNDDEKVFALKRQKDDNIVISLSNFSNEERVVYLSIGGDLIVTDAFSGSEITLSNKQEIILEPNGYKVYYK